MLAAASEPGDLVADLFCGSGTTLQVAEELGRRWVGCDLGRWAIHLTRKRLLSVEGAQPFQIVTFGAPQRRFWLLGPEACLTVGAGEERQRVARARALYTERMCALHGADASGDGSLLHGRRGQAWVCVAPPDLGPRELPRLVSRAVDACVTASFQDRGPKTKAGTKTREASGTRGHLCLHVLVPEWRPSILEPCVAQAKEKGVQLNLYLVPEEALEPHGDPQASGEARAGSGKSNPPRDFSLVPFRPATITATVLTSCDGLQVSLTGYQPPDPQPMGHPAEGGIHTWSDYVDYWAVGTRQEGPEGPIRLHWWAFRTRSRRELPLESPPLSPPADFPVETEFSIEHEGGPGELEVRVVDVFGRETSCTIPHP